MKIKLTSILCLTLSGDSLITISLIWLIIKLGGDTRVLGLFLFINTVIPYVFQLIYKKYFHSIDPTEPLASFIKTRLIGAICSLCLAGLFLLNKNIWILYLSASVFTIINFFSNQYLEGYFGTLVLRKKLGSYAAAGIQQTSLQLSVLLGASLSGFIISLGGFFAILLLNSCTYLFGAWGMTHFAHDEETDNALSNKNYPEKQAASNHWHGVNRINLNMIFLINLAVILYSFNFLLPFLVQKDHGWSANEFGLIDAFAAAGAFTSVITPLFTSPNKNVFHIGSYFLMVFSLFSFCLISSSIQAMASAFLFGFSLNLLRIKTREFIFMNTTSPELALNYGRHIAFINMVIKALSPLILGWIILQCSAKNLFFYLSMICPFLFVFPYKILPIFIKNKITIINMPGATK